MFRRSSSAGATDGKAKESEAAQSQGTPAETKPLAQAGKGRPTRKRSEAERNRYQSITGGTTSGRGTGGPPGRRTPEDKARAKSDRERKMSAMRRGEEWALGPRDRGPAKRLARDYVDSHRRVSEYYMYVLIVLLVSLFSQNKTLQTYIGPFVFVLIVVIAVDAFFIRRALRKLVAARCPGESTRGLTWYAVMRALQIRRFRMPQPAVKPGDKF